MENELEVVNIRLVKEPSTCVTTALLDRME